MRVLDGEMTFSEREIEAMGGQMVTDAGIERGVCVLARGPYVACPQL